MPDHMLIPLLVAPTLLSVYCAWVTFQVAKEASDLMSMLENLLVDRIEHDRKKCT